MDNPIAGPILSMTSTVFTQEILVPESADTLTYEIIGRVGLYLATVVDEELFDLTVTE